METKLEYQKVKVGTNLTTMSESWEHKRYMIVYSDASLQV